MSPADEGRWIVEAVGQTYRDAGLSWPPSPSGPMPLGELIRAYPVVHEEVPGLNRAAASAMLGHWGVRWAAIPEPDPSLAGFLYANAHGGYVFVRRGDILPRRRFTAAHELGHYRLHLGPELSRRGPGASEMIETDEDIVERDEGESAAMERQANRFAAELLMPEAVCRALHSSYSRKYGTAARFLIYHIAGELLVSREAIEWRLHGLGLIDEPPRRRAERRPVVARGETAEVV